MSRPPDKFRSRLKQLLGLKRDTSSSLSPQLPPIVVEDAVECDELLKEVHPESGNSVSSRSRIVKELCEVVAAKQLEEHAVEALWLAVKDLLEPENPPDVRHITLQFLSSLVTGQYANLKLLRAHFFGVIEDHNIAEDLTHRLQFLSALTQDGKDIVFCEERIGPFLLSLMPSVVLGEKLDIFLPLLRNFIRYNSSYLDEDVVSGLVKQTCQICTTTDKEKEVEQSLAILDAVVRYSSLPSTALYSFLVAVCNTVNVEQYCQPSWRLMKHLLGTHLGHNGVLTMCCILEDSNNWTKFSLLRGAIFFVGMCLWGSKRVTSLQHKPIAVLPSFYKVLSCDNESVICEVTLSMQRLVKKYGMKQHDSAWESILDIASALQEYVEKNPSRSTVAENFHVLLSSIEDLHEKHEYHGSADRLFAIVAKCTTERPESSVILLVSHRAQSLHPYCDNWFENIKDLVDKYFKCEERTAIRIKVLDVLCNILGTFSPLYEEEILENAVLPYLDHISKDQDIAVRIRAVQLLVDVIEGSDSQKVCDVLHIVEKVAHCPVDPLKRHVRPSHHGSNKEQSQDETSLEDIKEAVLGLVRLFKVKLFRKPQEHAERIFGILVYHIKAHYDNGYRTYIASKIRLAILECFLSLRADSCQRLGILQEDNGEVKFSSYFVCTERKSSSDDRTSGVVFLPYSEAMNVILMCLQQEYEWEVLDVVLKIIPETLQDKNLILSGRQYLNSICTVLSKMVSNYDFLNGLWRVPNDMRRPHLYARIFPVLTELCTYHPFIGQDEQFCLMRTMEIGLVAHSAALCVSCLTICMLEVPLVLARLLPTYLEKFAKLSPTPQVAIPLLEFLSALSHFRELYTNFTAVQLKQVFGICLPYTESSRYSQYTVTLAHNVICSWYVNCPLLLRKQFVAFITKSLKDTEISSKTPSPYPKIPTSPSKLQPPPAFPEKANEDSSNTLSSEMVEVAIDMMVKYTFSSSLTQPKRTAVVEQLLANGSSRSWLLGNVLVTVTVSKRRPSNMPCACAYCSSGRTSLSESLPRSRSDSLPHHSSPWNTSTSADHTSVENEGSPGIRHQISFDKENAALLQDTTNVQPSYTSTPHQTPSKTTPNVTGPSTTEPQTAGTEGSQDQPRDSTNECSCVCQGWAEFLVRRPTGNTSWILRLQNRPKIGGSPKQTPRLAMEQTAPQIYESVIPKQFFDDFKAELMQERARQRLATTTGLLSKSADSDTLIVDLIKDRLLSDGDLEDGTTARRNIDGLTAQRQDEALASRKEDDKSDREAEMSGTKEESGSHDDVKAEECKAQGSGDVEQKVSFSEDKEKSSLSSTMSQDSENKSSLGSSFVERTRYLSRSPMDGPSAFMLLDVVQDSNNGVLVESDAERSSQDLSSQDEFQKPVVGKSPLDASPLKTFLSQDDAGLSESDDDKLVSSDNEELSLNEEDDNAEPKPSLIQINACETPDANDVISSHDTNSLPGSRAQSPLSGLGLRNRISESSGGSVSLPTTPLSSRAKSPEFFNEKTTRKTARNGTRTVSPVADTTGRKTPTANVSSKQSKSATVDLGMLRRTSSSPEIDLPVKEKRGLLKLFDNVSDKEKKPPAVIRRQTMSGSQISRKKANRRSYNGPFPDSLTRGYERNAEDVTKTYDAMCPNFIFLQFYHSSWFGEDDLPLALPEQEFYHRAVKNLDRIPPYDTHKIGVIYVGPDQGHDEVAILRNQYGSSRYMEFISGLGELVRLRDCSLCEVYTGGLDRSGADGEYAYSWRSEIAQVMFHIATLMPNREKDPNCHSKKLHIGNDFVTIVYNDSKSAYKMGTIKGQFNFVEIVIKPLDNESNVVCLNVKDELKDILANANYGPRVISDKNLPALVRHTALHVNMASVIHKSQKTPTDAYGCNWLQRLRQIKRIQSRIPATVTESESLVSKRDLHNVVDFTKYILQ